MSIDINIDKNVYDINLDDLIVMGKRINNKLRNFLFISKVLGKHIEVKADVCKAIGILLASLAYKPSSEELEDLKDILSYIKSPNDIDEHIKEVIDNFTFNTKGEKVCVLGFAETATGLGMAVASSIEDSYYLTTTRENITEIKSLVNFEEEHSHATMHKCFPMSKEDVINKDRMILVDDEITTGKSMINIIRELSNVTSIKKYTILSILDWRSSLNKELMDSLAFEKGIDIEVLSLISGNISINDNSVFYNYIDNEIEEKTSVNNLHILDRIQIKSEDENVDYYKDSGRFGVNQKDIVLLDKKCESIAKTIENDIEESDKILVLGHGENIYIPSKITSYLKNDTYFKSTTRSPIFCENIGEYPIKTAHVFYDSGVKYYMYNKEDIEKRYDKVILITENDLNIKLTSNILIYKV